MVCLLHKLYKGFHAKHLNMVSQTARNYWKVLHRIPDKVCFSREFICQACSEDILQIKRQVGDNGHRRQIVVF